MRFSRAGIALVLLFVPTCVPWTVRADGQDDEGHVRRGIELRGQGKNREALEEFETAMSIRATPRARAQIGLAHQALGEWADAERDLDEALAALDDPWIARYRAVLEQSLSVVQAHLGWLWVESNVAGSELFVEGRAVGILPLPRSVRVPAGQVRLDVRSDGYVDAHRTTWVTSGSQAHEIVMLLPAPTAARSPESNPAASQWASSSPPLQLAPPPRLTRMTDRADHAIVSRRTSGILTLTAAGVLGLTGLAAWRIRSNDVDAYNDPSRCVFGNLTREQRCGSYRSAADVALGFEVGAFTAASAAVLVGEWLLATDHPKNRVVCGAWLGAGGVCKIAF